MRGRKHELVLEVDQKTGKIRVPKDGGMDVVLIHMDKGTAEVLNPRPMLVLEEKEGVIRIKEAPPKTKLTIVQPKEEVSNAQPAAPQA